MRNIIIITLAILLAPIANAAPQTHLQEGGTVLADESYRNGDYTTAINLYEETLATGYTSADLYYNLGNAYYRDGQMGRAILNYERALRLKPSMTDARENLALAESHTVDRISVLPKLFIARWIDILCTLISPTSWRIVWLVLLALVCISLIVMRLGSKRSIRKTGLITGVIMLLLLALATWMLLNTTRLYNAHRDAVVTQQSITVKSSPETQSADKFILHEGSRLCINDSLADWYKITIADGTTGWCQATDIERI